MIIFVLKAGRDADGLRVNRPTENVVVRNCIARKGAGLLTCGSETSGSIRNVLAHDLIAYGTGNDIASEIIHEPWRNGREYLYDAC